MPFGAVKTNRVIFPVGIRRQISQFAPYIHKTDPHVSLVAVGKRQYDVYRYEGHLNDLENAVVLISYPKDAFGMPKALRAFICTLVSADFGFLCPLLISFALCTQNSPCLFKMASLICNI